jgi:hypothetical protein
LEVVGSRDLTIEDRAASYAVLHQIQLRINRALKAAKDDIIIHIDGNHLKSLGPLSVKATAIDAAYPVNNEGNWGDAGVQEELEAFAKIAPDFIRKVPEHYEIRTFELGQAVHAGDPLARQLWKECNARGWRTEEGRRLSLAVREVKA